MWIKILAFFIAFGSMEMVAHLAHKYVMHGFLWILHKSHHKKMHGFWEKNDIYFLVFAAPGVLLIANGVQNKFDWNFYVGIGIATYGFVYLLVHDIIIHQRVKLFKRLENPYIKALRKAHKAHHANATKDAAVSYGMLWVDRKYFETTPIPQTMRGQNIIF